MSAFAENETLPDPEWTTNPGLSLLVAVAKDSASWTGRHHGRRHSLTDGIMRAMGPMICDVSTSCAVALYDSVGMSSRLRIAVVHGRLPDGRQVSDIFVS